MADLSVENLQLIDLENESACPTASSTPVQNFYDGTKIFITGATGFIGKALVEKLLRSCHGIDTIYILVRTKRGMGVEVRHEKLLQSSVFDRIRGEDKSVLKKIVCISGDVSEPDLGLSEADQALLSKEVNVVFHSAATVRFDEPIDEAFNLNTLATIKVLDLCRSMTQLKALVHVSTAYSNADKKNIKEEVYQSPAELEEVLEIIKIQDKSEQEESIKKIQGRHPNTYTLTKAMAESIVNKHAKIIPVSIVRPSIVTGAVREPSPGWVDNVSGISGVMIEIGRGTLRSIICDESNTIDVIPVDIVVNTLVAAAWQTHTHRRTDKAMVYNCVSGALNPIKWHDYGRLTEKHVLRNPSKYVQWYPWFSFRTNPITHGIVELFQHFIPALLIDLLMFIQGMKPIMFKIAKKFKVACKNGEFFALHGWNFDCDNMEQLSVKLSGDVNDGDEFLVDIKAVNWDNYVEKYVLGLRQYVLHDSLDSLPSARTKLQRIYWATQLVKVVSFGLLAVVALYWY